jgi:hypothetical protein
MFAVLSLSSGPLEEINGLGLRCSPSFSLPAWRDDHISDDQIGDDHISDDHISDDHISDDAWLLGLLRPPCLELKRGDRHRGLMKGQKTRENSMVITGMVITGIVSHH